MRKISFSEFNREYDYWHDKVYDSMVTHDTSYDFDRAADDFDEWAENNPKLLEKFQNYNKIEITEKYDKLIFMACLEKLGLKDEEFTFSKD